MTTHPSQEPHGGPDPVSVIKDRLSELSSATSVKTAELFVQEIIRAAGQLSRSHEQAKTVALLTVDLAALLRSEKDLAALEKRKEKLSEGFFKSFTVLRQEFEKNLAAPDSP